jgi:Family of unknown function (DUF6843)
VRTHRLSILTLALVVLVTCVQEPKRHPCKYFVPEGLVGWIQVYYEVSDAPPLQVEDGYLILRIPPNGTLQTSSKPEVGWAKDEVHYYTKEGSRILPWSGWGGGGMVWGLGSTIRSDGSVERESFFVGTEAEYGQATKVKEP